MDFIDLDGWKGEKKKICAFSTFLNFWKKLSKNNSSKASKKIFAMNVSYLQIHFVH